MVNVIEELTTYLSIVNKNSNTDFSTTDMPEKVFERFLSKLIGEVPEFCYVRTYNVDLDKVSIGVFNNQKEAKDFYNNKDKEVKVEIEQSRGKLDEFLKSLDRREFRDSISKAMREGILRDV